MDLGFIVTRPDHDPGAMTGGRHVLVKNAEAGPLPEAVRRCCVEFAGQLLDPWVFDVKAQIEDERATAAIWAKTQAGVPSLRRPDVKKLLGTDNDFVVNACVDHLGFPKGSLVRQQEAGNWIGPVVGSYEIWDGRAVNDWVDHFSFVFPDSDIAKRLRKR